MRATAPIRLVLGRRCSRSRKLSMLCPFLLRGYFPLPLSHLPNHKILLALSSTFCRRLGNIRSYAHWFSCCSICVGLLKSDKDWAATICCCSTDREDINLECAFRSPLQCALHQDRCASGGQSLEPTNLSRHLCAHKYLHAMHPMLLSAFTVVMPWHQSKGALLRAWQPWWASTLAADWLLHTLENRLNSSEARLEVTCKLVKQEPSLTSRKAKDPPPASLPVLIQPPTRTSRSICNQVFAQREALQRRNF